MNIIGFLKKEKNLVGVYALALIAFTIPFSVKLGNIAVILAIAFNVFFFKKSSLKVNKGFKFWYLISLFLITVISAFLSKNVAEGVRHLDLTLLMLLFAVIFLNSTITKKDLGLVLKVFALGTTISTLILLLNLVIKLFFYQVDTHNLIFHGFTALYDQHPVYFSLYISVVLLYLITESKGLISILRREYFFIAIIILVVGLILCASKAVIGFNVIFFLIFTINNIKHKTQKGLLAFVFIVFSFLIYKVPFIEHRFNNGLTLSETIINFKPTNDFTKKKLFNYEEKKAISDLEVRYLFVKIGLYHLYNDGKVLFGYGQGDTEDYLNYYYYSYNLGPNWLQDMNVHNQYLHMLIMYGIIVLFLFICYLFYSFYHAFAFKNELHLYFILLISFVFIFEVVLVRNKGIVFFYFFNSLFLFSYNDIKSSNIGNKRDS